MDRDWVDTQVYPYKNDLMGRHKGLPLQNHLIGRHTGLPLQK